MKAAIKATALSDYSADQIHAWAARVASAEQITKRCSDGRHVLVATDMDDLPIAFVDIESSGHLDFFFCHPNHIGTGVASCLYDQLEILARRTGINEIFTEASEAARRLFAHKGFSTVKRRDFMIGGVYIHNYAMRKRMDDE